MRPSNPGAGLVYQLKITLVDVKLPIWQRIQVSGGTTLSALHIDAHLHEFEVRERCYGVPEPDALGYEETPDTLFRHPLFLAGERRCTPEDCGGPAGYAEFLEIIGDPNHPEHRERLC